MLRQIKQFVHIKVACLRPSVVLTVKCSVFNSVELCPDTELLETGFFNELFSNQ